MKGMGESRKGKGKGKGIRRRLGRSCQPMEEVVVRKECCQKDYCQLLRLEIGDPA